MVGNNQDGGNNGCQCGIRGYCCIDVYLVQGYYFQCIVDDNIGFYIVENGVDQCIGDQGMVELKFIKY